MGAEEIKPRVTVLLPCLDEAASVGECVKQARRGLEKADLPGEVLVVDNGSTDGSAAVAEAAGARVIEERSRGYGSALRAGIEAAHAPVVVMADADATYDLGLVAKLAAPVLDGEADIVLGSRLNGISRRTMSPSHRLLGNPLLSFLVARAAGARIARDSQTGFRAFNRDAVRALGLRATGMEFVSEMLIRAAQAGLTVAETPAGYAERVGESKLNTFSDGWRNLATIALLAPELLLIRPGVVLLALGILVTVWQLIDPGGIQVGDASWQPVFFAGIAFTLGTYAVLTGMVLAHRSSLARGDVRKRFAFVGDQRFPGACFWAGVAAILAGITLEALRVAGLTGGARGIAVGSLAQSLLIVGAVLASFAVLVPALLRDSGL